MMSETLNGPSTYYGNRTLPQALDDLASSTPERLYASIPKDRDLSDGFVDIHCQDMARCVNFMAHWITSRLGRSAHFDTVAYIGIPDLRAPAVFLGAVKSGYKVSSCSLCLKKCAAKSLSEPGPAPFPSQPALHQCFPDAAD